MTKGLIHGIAYYIAAFLIVFIVHKWEGNTGHSPGLQHLLGFFLLFAGACWLLKGILELLRTPSNRYNLGITIINATVLTSIFIYFYFDAIWTDKPTMEQDPKEVITLNRNQDTSFIVDGTGDTIFKKIRDSVIIDKTKTWAK